MLFSVLMLGGLLVGLWLSKFSPRYYESSMVLRSEYLNPQMVELNIVKLDELCQQENFEELSRLLMISEEEAAGLKGFQFEVFENEEDKVEIEVLREKLKNELSQVNNADRIVEIVDLENRHDFKITLQSYHPKLSGTLSDPVALYFRNLPYVKKRLEIEEQNIAYKADNLRSAISELDSLQKLLDQNLIRMSENAKAGTISLSMGDAKETDQLSVLEEKLRILDSELDLRRQLFLQPKFEVIDSFTAFKLPSNPKLLKTLPLGLLSGFLCALALAAILELLSYMKSLEEQQTR
jgi:hypothetical protein